MAKEIQQLDISSGIQETKMKCVYLNFQKKNGSEYLDETTTLAVPLSGTGYGVGLFEVNGRIVLKDTNKKNKEVYLCSDICEDSNVNEIKMPVVRHLKRNPNGVITTTVDNVVWLRINRPEIVTIRMYIADSDGELVPLSTYRLSCLLLFTPAPTA